jgi:WD40 repeat protein
MSPKLEQVRAAISRTSISIAATPRAVVQSAIPSIQDVSLSADGLLAATLSDDGTIALWETKTQRELDRAKIFGFNGRILFSKSSEALFIAQSGFLWRYDLNNRSLAKVAEIGDLITCMESSPDGSALLIKDSVKDRENHNKSSDRLIIYSAGSVRTLATVSEVGGRNCGFSQDGTVAWLTVFDGLLRWTVQSGLKMPPVRPVEALFGAGALSPDGKLLILTGSERKVGSFVTVGYDLERQRVLWSENAPVDLIRFSSKGQLFIARGYRFELKDAQTGHGKVLFSWQGATRSAGGAAFSGDGDTVFVGGFGLAQEITTPEPMPVLRGSFGRHERELALLIDIRRNTVKRFVGLVPLHSGFD